jgi:hypothetical protein
MTSVFPDFPYSVDDGAFLSGRFPCGFASPRTINIIFSHTPHVRFFLCPFFTVVFFLNVEPTEDWTVEQTLQWWLLRAHDETEAKFEEVVQSLTKQMERGKEELWECHRHVKKILNNEISENVDPQIPTTDHDEMTKSQRQQATGTTTSNGTTTTADTIHVEITTGEYEGNSYDLKPKPKAPCWVGRSTGKKFRDRGISLTKDLEVSTTHGKFELLHGSKFYFTDVNSTNGSKVNGADLKPETPFELENGTQLILGQTTMKIILK